MTEAEKREAERRELAMQMQLAAAEAIRVARAERVGGGGNDEAEHPHSSAAHAAADPASLASAMHMQSEMRHALVAQHARVIDLFRQWDMNGDGRIRKRELRKALAALGYHVPPYMCDALFQAC